MQETKKVLEDMQGNKQDTAIQMIDDFAPRRATEQEIMRVSSMEHTFENFNMVPGAEDAFEAIYGIAAGRTPRYMAMIYGGTGSGKTHLLEAAVIELRLRGFVCRYYAFYELTDLLKGKMRRAFEIPTYDDILNIWKTCKMPIILDDIGNAGAKDTITEFEAGILEEIVDYRYRNGLATLMATNLDKNDLPTRVVSRLRDEIRCYLVLNKAGDYRKKLKGG